MPEFNNDYLEGYTKAKEEDREELDKVHNSIHTYEHEYAILKETCAKNAQFIQDNEQYIELGHALKTILDYIKGEENV